MECGSSPSACTSASTGCWRALSNPPFRGCRRPMPGRIWHSSSACGSRIWCRAGMRGPPPKVPSRRRRRWFSGSIFPAMEFDSKKAFDRGGAMDATTKNLESQLVLTAEQIDSFDRNGYLTLRGITTADDLAELRDIYERMFRDKTGLADGNYFDLSAGGAEGTGLPQITRMASYQPKRPHNPLWRELRAEATTLRH